MRCPYCGAEVHERICDYCNSEIMGFTSESVFGSNAIDEARTVDNNIALNRTADVPLYTEINSSAACVEEYSTKKKTTALILCILFGWLGVHHFYTGRWILGILYLCTYGLWGLGVVFDIVMIATDKYKDKNKRKLLK